MRHRLVAPGCEWLVPFAETRIRVLLGLGCAYADQSFEVNGYTIRVQVTPGHEYIRIEGGNLGEYMLNPASVDHPNGDDKEPIARATVAKAIVDRQVDDILTVKYDPPTSVLPVEWVGYEGALQYDPGADHRYANFGITTPKDSHKYICFEGHKLNVSPYCVSGAAIVRANKQEQEDSIDGGRYVVFAAIDIKEVPDYSTFKTQDISESKFQIVRFYRFKLGTYKDDGSDVSITDITLISECSVESLYLSRPWYFSPDGRSAVSIATPGSAFADALDDGITGYVTGYHPAGFRAGNVHRYVITASVSLTEVVLRNDSAFGGEGGGTTSVLIAADYTYEGQLITAHLEKTGQNMGLYIGDKLVMESLPYVTELVDTDFPGLYIWVRDQYDYDKTVFLPEGVAPPPLPYDPEGNLGPFDFPWIGSYYHETHEISNDVLALSHIDLRDRSFSYLRFRSHAERTTYYSDDHAPEEGEHIVSTLYHKYLSGYDHESDVTGSAEVESLLVSDGKEIARYLEYNEVARPWTTSFIIRNIGASVGFYNGVWSDDTTAKDSGEIGITDFFPIGRRWQNYASRREREAIFSPLLSGWQMPQPGYPTVTKHSPPVVVLVLPDSRVLDISKKFKLNDEAGFHTNLLLAMGRDDLPKRKK